MEEKRLQKRLLAWGVVFGLLAQAIFEMLISLLKALLLGEWSDLTIIGTAGLLTIGILFLGFRDLLFERR